MQTILGIDLETFSSIDITRSGAYKYVESPDFEVLLFAYSLNNAPVQIIDLTIDELPVEIVGMLQDPNVIKTAWNASFEIACLSKHIGQQLDPAQWQCTMALSAMLSLPLSLDTAAKALRLDVQKDAAGKALIKYFSVPAKPSKSNGERTRNLPEHAPEKWEQYKSYCVKDVEVEQAIKNKLSFFQVPERERRVWILDQQINQTGVLLDNVLVENAIRIDAEMKQKQTAEAISLTGLDNPNSVAQLKKWLEAETGDEVEGLTKKHMPDLLKNTEDEKVLRVLQLRQEMSKTSVKKYLSMKNCRCADGRARGLLQYGGASKTLRFAGRLIQIQNLPGNKLHDLTLARDIARTGDCEALEMLFGNAPDTLSQLIRTAFVAPPGKRFIVADLSAIEARVIAWLAGERWRLDVFKTHGKIYEASASAMFGIPLEKIDKALRQKGKVSELALGYSGGPNALIQMGALTMGVCNDVVAEAKKHFDAGLTTSDDWETLKAQTEQKELAKLVKMWRNSNKAITKFWYDTENAAIRAVKGETVKLQHGLKFFKEKGILHIQLPSGRLLSYIRPKLKTNRFGNDAVVFEGVDQNTKKWGDVETYSGKLVENIVQATAREVLVEGMLRIADAGYKIVLHVHDEICAECDEGFGSVEEMCKLMSDPLDWAKGLPLAAAGFETEYYKKD